MITMRTTIDKAGRVVIPKPFRKRAGLEPGMPLEIRYEDGRIEIEPEPVPVKLVRKGRWLVIVPQGKIPPMPEDVVAWARRERMEQIAGMMLDDEE